MATLQSTLIDFDRFVELGLLLDKHQIVLIHRVRLHFIEFIPMFWVLFIHVVVNDSSNKYVILN